MCPSRRANTNMGVAGQGNRGLWEGGGIYHSKRPRSSIINNAATFRKSNIGKRIECVGGRGVKRQAFGVPVLLQADIRFQTASSDVLITAWLVKPWRLPSIKYCRTCTHGRNDDASRNSRKKALGLVQKRSMRASKPCL